MLLHVPGVLHPQQVQACLAKLENAPWGDGRATAGYQSARVKDNEQIPEAHPVARELGEIILAALGSAPLFVMGALPFRVFPPLFNRYRGGEAFGTHIDNAIRAVPGGARLRTDLSATLFLSDPAEYDGGELVVEDSFGSHSVKLPPGDMVVYPASSLHHVRPVTSGSRVAAFFWVQSMVRDDGQRTTLFQLDTAIQQLARDAADHPALVQLTGVYHNLIRAWAEL